MRARASRDNRPGPGPAGASLRPSGGTTRSARSERPTGRASASALVTPVTRPVDVTRARNGASVAAARPRPSARPPASRRAARTGGGAGPADPSARVDQATRRRHRAPDRRERRLASEKSKSRRQGESRRRRAPHGTARPEEEPRQIGGRREVVVDGDEGEKSAAARPRRRARERTRARCSQRREPRGHSGPRERDVQRDREGGSHRSAQKERKIARIEDSRLELREPGLPAARERVPERELADCPPRSRVRLHGPEEVGEVSARRNEAGERPRAEERRGEGEPEGAAEERRPAGRRAALHRTDSRRRRKAPKGKEPP